MAYSTPIPIPELSYGESLTALHEIVKLGISPMLETVEEMLEVLGSPDAAFDSLQIVGTNGKTSTSRYAAAILSGEGLRTALYTSPELVSYTERMELEGAPVSEEAFAHGISAALEAGRIVNGRREAAGLKPYDITEFDLLTVGAMVVFAEAGIDVCVLECGMGGRWDATSAASSIKGVAITGVGLDHTHILGNTIEEIAAEKAATIKGGRFCVLGPGTVSPASAEKVFLERCAEQGVEPVLVRPERIGELPVPADVADAAGVAPTAETARSAHPELQVRSYAIDHRPASLADPLRLSVEGIFASYADLSCIKPAYQAGNIATSVVLCESYLGRALEPETLRAAVASCPTPGRFDVVRAEPLALIDAAHNPQSIEAFLSAVRALEPDRAARPTLLAAVLADKDARGIVELLAPEFERVVVCRTQSARALASSELGALFTEAGLEPVAVCGDVREALDLLRTEAFIACGSITLAGEIAALMRT